MDIGKKLVRRWIDTLENHEAEPVVKMYAKKGILLGTLATKPLVGREEIKTYFDGFVKLHPIGMISWHYTQFLGFGKVAVDGTYTFELDHNKARKSVDARFTFVFKRNWRRFGKWEIITHHSSEVPTKPKKI
jgi:uncharacterized protein (TIGR02246 family)